MFNFLKNKTFIKAFIVILILILSFTGYMVYTFIPRVIQTYNCDGYKIYKILTQNPTYMTYLNIDSPNIGGANGMYDVNTVMLGNYPNELPENTVKDTKTLYGKYTNCKSLDFDLVTGVNQTTYTEFCYLLNRTNRIDYPDCSKAIKAKFGIV